MNTLYAKISTDWNKNFIGYSALAIILSTSIGSIAIMTTMMHGNGVFQMSQVFLIVSACSAHNASIISVQKPKLVFNLLIMSIFISVTAIATGLLF